MNVSNGIKVAVIGVAAVVVLKSVDIRGCLSALVEDLAEHPDISPDLARDAFATNNVDPVVPTQGHTHPIAASARTSATNFARKLAAFTGGGLYVLEMSKSDQRKGLRGSRQWYWSKDTNVENRSDIQLPDDIEYICDVDYYIDMPNLLASRSKPTLMYTVVPESASSHVDDTSICFEEDGRLRTLVAGGGSYVHHLWDYAGDSLKATTGRWFSRKLVTYAIERKQVSVNRQLVLLAPIREFNGLTAYLAEWILEGKTLRRFNPIVRGKEGAAYVRFGVHRNGGNYVTTGRAGQLLSATIPADIDAALHLVASNGSTAIQLPTVVSWLGREDRAAAIVLVDYLRHCLPRPLPYVYPVELGVRAYQFEPHSYDAEAKPKLHAFMSPIIHGAFAPVGNAAGERRCVKGRITDLRAQEPKACAFRDQCIVEFADMILGGEVLEPVCLEVVHDKQTSPAQRASLARAVINGNFRNRVLKCFIKAEAYQGPKDPRNISTYNDADKLDMATFALALSNHCKKFSWYGPGKTPIEIAKRVAEICATADFVNVSDYTRMDGTITYVLRQVDRCVVMRAFIHHRAKLNELLKTNVDNKGILPHGTTFDQGPSHGSGCSATSVFQTLRAAFASYLAYRHRISEGGTRLSKEEAFGKLGIHLGDDGLDAELPIRDHEWACSKLGLRLEASIIPRGYRGVNFLARYYSPDVWNGSLNSMCDLGRQLSKFHTTVRLPEGVTEEHKLVEKCMSYVATDGNTPVIGGLCKRVLVLSTFRPKKLLGVGNWWSRFEASVQYPNENVDGWMEAELDHLIPGFDRTLFDHWLGSAKSIKEVLEPPLCLEPKPPSSPKADVVVDGDILSAPQSSTDETASVENDSTGSQCKGRRKRRKRAAGKPGKREQGVSPRSGKVKDTKGKETK